MSLSKECSNICAVLTLSGASISEMLALVLERIEDRNITITIETLKQRRKRGSASPSPRQLLRYLNGVDSYREAQRNPKRRRSVWSRSLAHLDGSP